MRSTKASVLSPHSSYPEAAVETGGRLQYCPVIFPLLSQLRHEGDEVGILSKAIQIAILLEQRVAGEPVLGCYLQPLDCLIMHVSTNTGSSPNLESPDVGGYILQNLKV